MKKFLKKAFQWCSHEKRPLFIVPLGILLITIFYLLLFPRNTNFGIEKSDILSFWGDYLSFAGAFCLGYFIYLQDKNRILEEKRVRVRCLLDTIEKSSDEWFHMAFYTGLEPDDDDDVVMAEQQKYFRDFLHKIVYNPDWRRDYYEYESIKGEDSKLQETIEVYFRIIDRINVDFETNNISAIAEVYDKYMKFNMSYRSDGYSIFDAIDMISIVAKKDGTEQYQPLFQQENIKNEIAYYGELLFPIIEGYICRKISEDNGRSVMDTFEFQKNMVDWICENVDETQKYVEDKPEMKRVISRVVSNDLCRLRGESKKIDYKKDGSWYVYTLKNN